MSGCEKNVTVNLPEGSKKLVLNSVVFSGETIHANLTRSLSNAESGKSIDASVTGAQMILYKDGQAVDTLSDEGYGLYMSETEAEAGHQYRMVVTHPAYPTIDAESEAPAVVPISSFSIVPNARSGQNSGDLDLLRVRFNDPAAAGDHYIMQIFGSSDYNKDGSDFYSWGDCITVSDPSFETPYGADLPGDEACYPSRSLFIKDAMFNGREKEASMYVSSYTMNPYWDWQGTDTTYPFVNLCHVTPQFYQFVKSFRGAQNASDNPFAEPFNVVSNVKGGYGVFSIVSVERVEVRK